MPVSSTSRRRAMLAWAITTLSIALAGGVLAIIALSHGHFPFLGLTERLILVVRWTIGGAVTGAAMGLLNAAAAAFIAKPETRAWAFVLVTASALGFVEGSAILIDADPPTAPGRALQSRPDSSARCAQSSPNLVLVSIDTLRRDSLSLYGYERRTSPALDAFARGGAVFENAVAHAPATLRSMAALLTGLQPWWFESEGEVADGARPFLDLAPHTVVERLAACGYDTAGFVSNPSLVSANGFARGFARYDEATGMYGADTEGRVRNVEHVITPALAWLDRARTPFFLWVHLMDPHHPYEPSVPGPWEETTNPAFQSFDSAYRIRSIAEYTRRLRALGRGTQTLAPGELAFLVGRYDAEVLQTDRGFARLIEGLREHGHDDTDTLVAVTADHGEEFLEHGRFLHSETLFDEMVRVPLVLRGPGVPVGKRVARQVRHVDLSATLLAVAGAAIEGVEGESLVGRWDAPSGPAVAARSTKYLALRTPERKLVVSFLAYPQVSVNWIPGLGLREMKEIALVRPPRHKVGLWHLDADPGEREDVFAQNRSEARDLYEVLLGERALYGQPSPNRAAHGITSAPPPAQRETLRALGYVD